MQRVRGWREVMEWSRVMGCWGGSVGPGATVGLTTWEGLRTGDRGKDLGSQRAAWGKVWPCLAVGEPGAPAVRGAWCLQGLWGCPALQPLAVGTGLGQAWGGDLRLLEWQKKVGMFRFGDLVQIWLERRPCACGGTSPAIPRGGRGLL